MSEKFVSFHFMGSRIPACEENSLEVAMRSGFRHEYRLSTFLLNYATGNGYRDSPTLVRITISVFSKNIWTAWCFGEDPCDLQIILDPFKYNVAIFGMLFTPSQCRVLLEDWVGSKLNVVGQCILLGGLILHGVSLHIQKVRLAFTNLRHLWRQRDIWLSIKGRM